MIKIIQGWVGSPDGKEKVDIVVKSFLPNKPVEILIGSTLILGGVAVLTYTAFKNGADCHETAELEALSKIGCI